MKLSKDVDVVETKTTTAIILILENAENDDVGAEGELGKNIRLFSMGMGKLGELLRMAIIEFSLVRSRRGGCGGEDVFLSGRCNPLRRILWVGNIF